VLPVVQGCHHERKYYARSICFATTAPIASVLNCPVARRKLMDVKYNPYNNYNGGQYGQYGGGGGYSNNGGYNSYNSGSRYAKSVDFRLCAAPGFETSIADMACPAVDMIPSVTRMLRQPDRMRCLPWGIAVRIKRHQARTFLQNVRESNRNCKKLSGCSQHFRAIRNGALKTRIHR